MKLNQFTDIGLRTLIYLSQPIRETPFTIKKAALELQVSSNHLVKVVNFMVRQKWINSTRGRNGGISLAKPLHEYPLGRIIKALEGAASHAEKMVNCDSPPCPLISHCKLNGILDNAIDVFLQYLDKYTLYDAIHDRQGLASLNLITTLKL